MLRQARFAGGKSTNNAWWPARIHTDTGSNVELRELSFREQMKGGTRSSTLPYISHQFANQSYFRSSHKTDHPVRKTLIALN